MWGEGYLVLVRGVVGRGGWRLRVGRYFIFFWRVFCILFLFVRFVFILKIVFIVVFVGFGI